MYTLHDYYQNEILRDKKHFSWLKIFKRIRKSREANFLFWFRLSYVLHRKNSKLAISIAKKINNRIRFKFNCDIHRNSEIGIGLTITHLTGIVIHPQVKIGNNFLLHQNTTIGSKGSITGNIPKARVVTIGNNVCIGAHCCILGDDLKIGNNVVIGAMSFVNKDIKSNTTLFTKKVTVSE